MSNWIESNLITPEMEILFEQVFGEKPAIVFGEFYGKNINKGRFYSANYKFAVFDIMINELYLSHESVVDITQKLGLDMVPILGVKPLMKWVDFVLDKPDSTIYHNPSNKIYMEGVVVKPLVRLLDGNGKRLCCKIKWQEFKNFSEKS